MSSEDMAQILKSKPKRPVNSYLLWVQENKERIFNENEEIKNLPVKEKTKKLGELYEQLDEQTKEEYKARAKKDADDYKEILEKYYADHPGLKEYEEQQRQEKKAEKQNKQERIPVKLQFNDINMTKMIQVACIKKYYKENNQIIKNDKEGRKYLQQYVQNAQNEDLQKEQWQQKWDMLTKEQREDIINYFKDWQESTREVKQQKDKSQKQDVKESQE